MGSVLVARAHVHLENQSRPRHRIGVIAVARPSRLLGIVADHRWHCQIKFYTACSRTMVGWNSAVFAHELPPRSAGFDSESGLYLFALTVPAQATVGN